MFQSRAFVAGSVCKFQKTSVIRRSSLAKASPDEITFCVWMNLGNLTGSRMKNLDIGSVQTCQKRRTDDIHWCVVEHPIKNTLLGSHFDSESSWVSGFICRASCSSHSGETHSDGSTRSLLEDFGRRQLFRKVCSSFEEAMSTSTSSMNDSLGNTFAVERRQSIDHVDILEKQWSLLSSPLSTKRLEVLLAIALGVRQVGVVQGGLFLLEICSLEKIRVVDACSLA